MSKIKVAMAWFFTWLFTRINYKFQVKDNYVYVLTKVFLDTGADIVLASKSFSRCLNMTKQSNIHISGILDETRIMQNTKMCKANIPYKGIKNIYSMDNDIKKVSQHFSQGIFSANT